MVIAYLFAVAEVVRGSFRVVIRCGDSVRSSNLFRHMSQQVREHRFYIFRQVPAVGTRVGDQLLLIEGLGVVQRLLGRKAKHTV